MWTFLGNFLSRSNTLNASLGDVLFEMPAVRGQSSHSHFQWRIKKSLRGNSFFIALNMLPDTYEGPEGAPRNYISFDIATAERIRTDLDRCIAAYHRLTAEKREPTDVAGDG